MSYISSDGHFSEVYLDSLVTVLKSLLDMLYCRVTALDKQLNSCVGLLVLDEQKCPSSTLMVM